jgi:hypothetical protein
MIWGGFMPSFVSEGLACSSKSIRDSRGVERNWQGVIAAGSAVTTIPLSLQESFHRAAGVRYYIL